MTNRFHRAALLLILVISTTVGALLGCTPDHQGVRQTDHEGLRQADGRSRETLTTTVTGIPPALPFSKLDEVLDPKNRDAVMKYLASLQFVPLDPKEFPAWETDGVELCDTCETGTDASITPEIRSMHLRPDDFPGKLRVIARASILRLPPDTGTANLYRLGLVKGNAENMSYELVLGNGESRFIYYDGTKYLASPYRRSFTANVDLHQLHHPMARWFPLEDSNHLSGTWVACLEGCCTSNPIE
jgi:hypothetical protein